MNNVTNQYHQEIANDFIMSPKIDFAFKLIFGDENHKDILMDFLSTALGLPIQSFEDVELINTELLRTFQEDKKGILDVRVKTKKGEHIDIEIQVLPTDYMPARTLFYWSKMYGSQIKAGDTYDKLKKCITINIVDFKCLELNKVHSKYHMREDETGHELTDLLEIHFLELPKVKELDRVIDPHDPVVEWLKFLNAKSKEEMEVLAHENENIANAYEVLMAASQDETNRMAYEAREAEIKDQLTRLKAAEERGIEQGIEQAAKALLDLLDDETIASKLGLTIEEVKALRK